MTSAMAESLKKCQTDMAQLPVSDALKTCKKAVLNVKQPDEKGDVLGLLAQLYQNNGQAADARMALEEAIQYYQSAGGKSLSKVVGSQIAMARLAEQANDVASAERRYRDALMYADKSIGKETLEAAAAADAYGGFQARTQRWNNAEKLFRRSIRLYDKLAGPASISTLEVQLNYAVAMLDADKVDEAESSLNTILNVSRGQPSERSETAAETHGFLASIALDRNDLPKALEHHKKALALRESLFGPNDLRTSQSINNIGVLQFRLGNLDEAERMLSRAYVVRRDKLGENAELTVSTRNNLIAVVDASKKRDGTDPAESPSADPANGLKKVLNPAKPGAGQSGLKGR